MIITNGPDGMRDCGEVAGEDERRASGNSNEEGEVLRTNLAAELRWMGLRNINLHELSEESLRTFREQITNARVLAQRHDIDGCHRLLRDTARTLVARDKAAMARKNASEGKTDAEKGTGIGIPTRETSSADNAVLTHETSSAGIDVFLRNSIFIFRSQVQAPSDQKLGMLLQVILSLRKVVWV